MAFYDEIPQPLRFYTDVDFLAFTRRPYSDVIDRPQIICDKTLLMPFILTRTASATEISSILLVNKDGTSTDITTYFNSLIDIQTDSTFDYIRYYGNVAFSSSLSYGVYRLVIADGTNTWYSEYFKIKELSSAIEFEYWNTKDIGNIVYQEDFKFRFSINGFIKDSGKYQNYVDEIENRNKDIFKTFQRKDKLWQVEFFANSYLYDAVQFMEMHDNIVIYDRDNASAEIEITDIIAEPISKTDYLSVKIEFKVSDNKILVGATDSNLPVREYVTESGIYLGKKKLYIGGKKVRL